MLAIIRCRMFCLLVRYGAPMGERRGAYRVLLKKPGGKGPLGRLRRRWEDNIEMVLQEVGWGHGLE